MTSAGPSPYSAGRDLERLDLAFGVALDPLFGQVAEAPNDNIDGGLVLPVDDPVLLAAGDDGNPAPVVRRDEVEPRLDLRRRVRLRHERSPSCSRRSQ
jgi:hypothetical protein